MRPVNRIGSWIIGAVVVLLAASFVGCQTNEPRRKATLDAVNLAQTQGCRDYYASLDQKIWKQLNDKDADDGARSAFLNRTSDEIRQSNSKCWDSSYEPHPGGDPSLSQPYDLFVAEFDDQGMPADRAAHALPFNQSQIYLIETQLRKILAEEEARNGGVNLVVFTHGWHGNASASDNYSIGFKAILQKITQVEAASPLRKSVNVIPRRTVGVEIAWRGDSFLHPGIPFIANSQNAANIWDRKRAAETIAKGAIHDLLEFLNDFYLSNSCGDEASASAPPETGCDRVHMLALGHSFGALITFSTLIGRIERGLNAGCDRRAYAFGDLTVLLNPAFEGSRYAPVFESALHHRDTFGHFPGGTEPDDVCASKLATDAPSDGAQQVQLPVMVTLQSAGDTATQKFFPAFKFITTPFTNTIFPGETTNERTAAGWVAQFRTHQLGLQTSSAQNVCYQGSADPKWYCPRGWETTSTKPVLDPSVALVDQHQVLQWTGIHDGSMPQYMPIWSVLVSTSIMANHDDIWNPRIVALIAELFRDAFEQADARHYAKLKQSQSVPPPR
jgi:hypothetical protein